MGATGMIIEHLHLQSFKGFRDFNLECSQFTVLVGRNNGGKTSILQAIQLLHDIFVFAFGNGEQPDSAILNGMRIQDPLSAARVLLILRQYGYAKESPSLVRFQQSYPAI